MALSGSERTSASNRASLETTFFPTALLKMGTGSELNSRGGIGDDTCEVPVPIFNHEVR